MIRFFEAMVDCLLAFVYGEGGDNRRHYRKLFKEDREMRWGGQGHDNKAGF